MLVWTLACVVLVCWHWGGSGGNFSVAMIGCVAVCSVLPVQSYGARPLWLPNSRHLPRLCIAALVIASVAVGAGSYFIDARFATVGNDFDDRIKHWNDSLSLIENNSEWLLGIGVGHYADRYFWHAPVDAMPGGWHIGHEDEDHFLTLGGSHFAQLMRVTQRIDSAARGPFVLHLRARAIKGSTLRAEVCRKQLIYPAECVVAWELKVPASNKWMPVSYLMPESLPDSPWYAPAPITFAIALYMDAPMTQVSDIDLRDAEGRSLLKNGDFEAGISHWFFSSDRVHLPWHAKDIFVHLLVEQGWLGLSAFCLCLVAAFYRLLSMSASQARAVAAPVFLAALSGVVAVGLFDSLLDVPRDAVFIYLLLGIALMLPTTRHDAHKP